MVGWQKNRRVAKDQFIDFYAGYFFFTELKQGVFNLMLIIHPIRLLKSESNQRITKGFIDISKLTKKNAVTA